MNTIPQVAEAMQKVLTVDADRLGQESGFVRRVRNPRSLLLLSFSNMLLREAERQS